jgi:hypothetical protein
MDSLLVPSSIQRIRSFLVEMCGMKVKPWAGTEETLAALHTTLVAKYSCGIFWDSLRTLLERLAHDLKTRASATPGTVIDNEILDSQRYASLLDEIRQSLDRQAATATGSFRHLSTALSAPALSLLLLLGGVASVGCDHSGLKPGNGKPDAGLAADTSVTRPDTGSIPTPDTGFVIPTDGSIRITLPDTAPDHDAATRSADGGVVTIKDIMDSCNIPKTTQDQVLACLARLRDSWTTGVAQTLTGAPCDYVSNELDCFASASQTCMQGSNDEFVVGTSRICKPVLIYLGVRFV